MGTVYHSTRDYDHYGKHHGQKHVNGEDDIQDATTAQKGLMTATQASKLNGIEELADVTDADNVASAINGVSGKSTPADADKLALIDSESGNVLKYLSMTDLKAALKTYFDTLYAPKL